MSLNKVFQQQVLAEHNNKVKIKKQFAQWLFPHSAERAYERKMVKLFDLLNNKTEKILHSELDPLVKEANSSRPDNKNIKLDIDWVYNVKNIYEKIESDYNLAINENVYNMTLEQAQEISDYNKLQLKKVIYSALAIKFFLQEPYLESQIKAFQLNNVSLIKNLSEQQAKSIEEILFRNLMSGGDIKAIAQEIEKKLNITKNRAKFIARDQTSKFNADLTKLRQQQLGITHYKWVTMRDNAVRATHRANEGKIFAWSEPSTITGHPGRDPNCRCIAQPIINEKMFLLE